MKLLTLTRKCAAIKLKSACTARYFFQRKGQARYERKVPIAEVCLAFDSNGKYRLKINPEMSEHLIYAVKSKDLQYGYTVEFPGEKEQWGFRWYQGLRQEEPQ